MATTYGLRSSFIIKLSIVLFFVPSQKRHGHFDHHRNLRSELDCQLFSISMLSSKITFVVTFVVVALIGSSMALPEPIGETFDQVPHPANAAGNLPAEHNNMLKRMKPAEATFALSLQDYLTIVKKDHQASILDVVREMKEKLGQTTNSSLEEQIYDECTDKVMSLLDDQEKNLLLQKTALSVNEDVVRRQEEEKMSLKRRLRRALDCILCFTCKLFYQASGRAIQAFTVNAHCSPFSLSGRASADAPGNCSCGESHA